MFFFYSPVHLSQVVVRVHVVGRVSDGGQEVAFGLVSTTHKSSQVVVGTCVSGPQSAKQRERNYVNSMQTIFNKLISAQTVNKTTRLHGTTTQNTLFFVVTLMRVSNLATNMTSFMETRKLIISGLLSS